MIIEECDENRIKLKDFIFDPLELIDRVSQLEERIKKLEGENIKLNLYIGKLQSDTIWCMVCKKEVRKGDHCHKEELEK